MTGNCPVCDQPSVPVHRPFCSRGCRDRDLLRWLDDGYRIPGGSDDEATVDGGVDNTDPAD